VEVAGGEGRRRSFFSSWTAAGKWRWPAERGGAGLSSPHGRRRVSGGGRRRGASAGLLFSSRTVAAKWRWPAVRGAGLLFLMDNGGEVEVDGGEGRDPSSLLMDGDSEARGRSRIWPAAPHGRAATARDSGDSTARAA
jgi:hypothetical protein